MDLALTATFRPEYPQFRRNLYRPISLRRHLSSKPPSPRPTVIVMAQKKPKIEGVSDELNSIASQNLDHAAARRRVRSAFANVQLQLDHILFKMAPAGIRTEEWYEMNSNGQEIFCKSWLPKPGVRIKGALCFCHGYGDTCTFFFEGIAKHIAASGYGVYAIDHPGFGLSEGLHGYVPSFDAVVDNVIEQYRIMKDLRGNDTPCSTSEGTNLSIKGYATSKARPQKDLADLAFRELKKKQMVASPMLILHGAADKVTDPRVSQFLYDKASSTDKTLKLYEGGFHCILEGEPDDRILAVLSDIISWLDSRTSLK
ncbi:Caffeoylshikimate esterase [Sesamum angolense]|uniref:Caffeoylshikimate esterase n=1 Tax=Sesamum angolense TaxID=2727404 RepID=A0AAE1WUQ7_9LAMI|nr:Caffeoylshikimate esterase [Sesamum angolense]